MKIAVPDDELMAARREVERLVSDAGLSDPAALDDEALTTAVDDLLTSERSVSERRTEVFVVLDALRDELKRRYKDDPSLALE